MAKLADLLKLSQYQDKFFEYDKTKNTLFIPLPKKLTKLYEINMDESNYVSHCEVLDLSNIWTYIEHNLSTIKINDSQENYPTLHQICDKYEKCPKILTLNNNILNVIFLCNAKLDEDEI